MKPLKGKKVLITAGPTREYIDPVRYISNDSSGKMGFALAEAAKRSGAKVTLISGPVNLKTPRGVKRIDVVSAEEMFKKVKASYKSADIIIMAAAVADFRPSKFSKHKIKKTCRLADLPTCRLELKKNSDILKWLGSNKRKGQILVGFALETENIVKNAAFKMRLKKCDLMIANHASVVNRDTSSIQLLSHSKNIKIGRSTKSKIASVIISNISGIK